MYHQTTHSIMPFDEKPGLLIVDDEPEILFSLQFSLRRNYRVYTAENLTGARNHLQQEIIHVVMCDERMPNESGAEFLAEVKGFDPQIVRIVFSGYTDTQYILAAVNKAHAFKFLTKPWQIEDLEATLSEAMEHYFSIAGNRYLDSITQLNAPLVMKNQLAMELSRCKRYKHYLSCVMIQVNVTAEFQAHYPIKKIHDARRTIADAIREKMRESDMAGIWSENSFLILLPNTDEVGAEVFWSRIANEARRGVETLFPEATPDLLFAVASIPSKSPPTAGNLIKQLIKSLG